MPEKRYITNCEKKKKKCNLIAIFIAGTRLKEKKKNNLNLI